MNATDPRASALDSMPSPKTDPQARPSADTHPVVAFRLAARAKAPKAGRSIRRAPAWRKDWRVA